MQPLYQNPTCTPQRETSKNMSTHPFHHVNRSEFHILLTPLFTNSMESTLDIALLAIRSTRKFDQDWKLLLPKVTTRICNINAKSPATTTPDDITKQIEVAKQRISNRLLQFPVEPPFTIVRLAELLLAPEEFGYPLTTPQHVLKYFNALSRLVCVSSTVLDFPQPTFHDPKLESSKTSTVTVPTIKMPAGPGTSMMAEEVTVQMVEIPWLQKKAPPASPQTQLPPTSPLRSPMRRRRESKRKETEEPTKRAKTSDLFSEDDHMDISNTTLEDDEQKDRMDISTENILEESERSEVCTPG